MPNVPKLKGSPFFCFVGFSVDEEAIEEDCDTYVVVGERRGDEGCWGCQK